MFETIIVIVVVLITALLLVKHFIKSSRSENGGCQFCAHASSCSTCNIKKEEK